MCEILTFCKVLICVKIDTFMFCPFAAKKLYGTDSMFVS